MPRHARSIVEVARDFAALLELPHKEQTYQEYLEQNPVLLPREFIQNHGFHLNLVLRKLSLGRDFVTDFFYLSKSSADWNCVLVEIEKPSSRYFRDGSNDFHPDFLAALNQIDQWRAWFEVQGNFQAFVDGTVGMLRIPAPMTANTCHIKYVLVMGRREEFAANEARRRLITVKKREDFKILSYDSLLEGLHAKGELYIGVRHNDHVELISLRFAEESLFSSMPPEQLRIRKALKDDIEAHRQEWYTVSPRGEYVLDEVLPKIRLID